MLCNELKVNLEGLQLSHSSQVGGLEVTGCCSCTWSAASEICEGPCIVASLRIVDAYFTLSKHQKCGALRCVSGQKVPCYPPVIHNAWNEKMSMRTSKSDKPRFCLHRQQWQQVERDQHRRLEAQDDPHLDAALGWLPRRAHSQTGNQRQSPQKWRGCDNCDDCDNCDFFGGRG